MIRQFVCAAFIAALALSACQHSGALSESQKTAITNEVRQMLHDYYGAVRSGGLLAEFEYLDHSPDFFWVPPGYTSWIDYDSVAAVLTANAPVLKSIDNVWDTLRIDALTPDYATYTGKLRTTMIDTTGIVANVSAIETGLVIKRKAGWKLLRGQTALLPGDGR